MANAEVGLIYSAVAVVVLCGLQLSRLRFVRHRSRRRLCKLIIGTSCRSGSVLACVARALSSFIVTPLSQPYIARDHLGTSE